MIFIDKSQKRNTWHISFFRAIKFLLKPLLKPIPVKFPFKYFLITVISTIIIWTLIASAVIYKNSYKPIVGELADQLKFKGLREKHRTEKAIKSFILAPYNWFTSHVFPEELPHIFIDIKFKNYQKIVNKREESVSRGFLIRGSDDYVPATLNYNKKQFRVRLRLKGDLGSHWESDKWSFRVHMKSKDHLFGMRRFSLQNPEDRVYEGAILFFEALRREGILTPRYFFVDLTVNGKYIGIMALEEHFSKELLESQGRKESVILKFDESLWFHHRGREGPFDHFRTNPIKSFRTNKILKSKTLSNDLDVATGLLRGFSKGDLSSSQVFDAELWGKYLAVASAWGGWHSIRWRNIRLYYNPIKAKFEPIPFDEQLNYSKRKSVYPTSKHNVFSGSIFAGDPNIKKTYEETLARIEKDATEGIVEKWAGPIINKNLRILQKEYPLLGGFELFGLAQSASDSLNNSKTHYNYRVILRSYLVKDQLGKYLEISNPLPHPVTISSIYWVEKKTGSKIKFNPTNSLITYPIKLLPTPKLTIPKTIKHYYSQPEYPENYNLLLSAHIDGDTKEWTIEPSGYFAPRKSHPIPDVSIEQSLQDHPFLSFHPEAKSLEIKQGHWAVNGPLIIPKGINLIIQNGTTLRFNSESGIISSGPILIEGTKDLPVIIKGSGKHVWQGIVVLDSKKPSKWSHVQILNTSGINMNGWSLTGGVNFYESDIKMDHVSFIGNQSEDALNITRSKFELKNVTIKNTASDGFDSDFSSGIMENSRFENIGSQSGGDGVDVSGSEVTLTNTYFKNISDKGISVGERSNLKANNIDLKKANIGAASKDGSLLFISDSKFLEIRKAGLMAYIKKPEYSSPEIIAENIIIESMGDKIVSQKGSKVTIDGTETSPVDLNVKKLYGSDIK